MGLAVRGGRAALGAARAACVVAMLALFGSPWSSSAQALGQFLVMDSTGLALKPGQEIDLTRPLTLRPGEKLSLIGYNGFILRFVGPATVTAEQVANPYAGKFFDPLRSLVDRMEKSGALRSASTAGRNLGDPWYVDVSRPGPRCVLERNPVTVWRDTPGQAQTLVIGPAGASWAATVDWPMNSQALALGGEFRFDNGERVVAELEGVVNELTIHVIPRSVSTPAAQAAWMIEKGCEDQAVVIVRGLIGN